MKLEMKEKWSREREDALTDAGWADEEKIRAGLSLNEPLLHLPRLSVGTLAQSCPAPSTHAATPLH